MALFTTATLVMRAAVLSKEDFDSWRENPATQQVFKVLEKQAAFVKELAIDRFWNGWFLEPADQISIALQKGESKGLEQLSAMDYEQYVAWCGEKVKESE